ncbi:MAG: bifunctional 4-hydroxy-2-oxoglutarate aldolase/2-dehydro-3-deoxy-phosphogluconate aldolase [Acidimicrobiales bacterium]|nr:bifunctional 4-hydroxy-2-oxoglutarate aldolase/2-dehydro-3-deoxy-phosphogluconate aldolase [Acidimicrobiales bacterium]
MGKVRVVPVLTIEDAESAPNLVSALVAGGLRVVEVTLRTPAALQAIQRAANEVADAVVGAGSVTSSSAVGIAIDAGAQFIVSPGLDEGVITACLDRGVAVIPGIATASELLHAIALGVDVVKLFPAEVVGGPAMISALSAVWPDVRFMPTGGISATNARNYFTLPQVLAVGGSWMVSSSAVGTGDWASITASAVTALELTRELP